jgi:hypothetical protein
MVTHGHMGYPMNMVSAILDVIRMVVGLVLDIVTLPFRALFALLGGAEFEFRRFSAPRGA